MWICRVSRTTRSNIKDKAFEKLCFFSGHLNNIIKRTLINNPRKIVIGCSKTWCFSKTFDFSIIPLFHFSLTLEIDDKILVFWLRNPGYLSMDRFDSSIIIWYKKVLNCQYKTRNHLSSYWWVNIAKIWPILQSCFRIKSFFKKIQTSYSFAWWVLQTSSQLLCFWSCLESLPGNAKSESVSKLESM